MRLRLESRFLVALGTCFIATSILLTSSALATEGWQLRFAGNYVDLSSELDFTETDVDGDRTRIDTDAASGLGVVAEYRFTPVFGIEMGASWSQSDIELAVTTAGGATLLAEDTMNPFTFTLGTDFHLTPDRRADLYIGPLVGFTTFNDLRFVAQGGRAEVVVDDEFAFGGVVGLDVPLADGNWMFCTSVRYLEADLDSTVDGERDIRAFDPLTVGLGFGYRF